MKSPARTAGENGLAWRSEASGGAPRYSSGMSAPRMVGLKVYSPAPALMQPEAVWVHGGALVLGSPELKLQHLEERRSGGSGVVGRTPHAPAAHRALAGAVDEAVFGLTGVRRTAALRCSGACTRPMLSQTAALK